MPAKSRILIALGLTPIYASCYAIIKAGLVFAPPLRFGGLRALIGGATLLVLAGTMRQPVLPTRRNWPWVLGLAVTATSISFAAMFLSPGRTSTGIASVLGNMQPLIIVVLATLFLGEQITCAKYVALAFGLAGVTLIAYPALAGPDAYGLSGSLLAVGASSGAAVGSIMVKRMGPQPNLLAITAWQLILGSLPLLIGSILAEPDVKIVWNTQFIAFLLFLGLIGTALTTAIWYWLIQDMEVGRLSLFLFLVPLFGLSIGAFILREAISPLEGIGAALLIAGIAFMVWESYSKPASLGGH